MLEPLQDAEAQVQPPEYAAIRATGLQEMIANIVGGVMAQGRAAGVDAADVRDIGAPHPFQAEGQEGHARAEISDVDKVLIVCGIEDLQTRETIRISEAFATLETFRLLEDDDAVDAWLKRAYHKRAPNNLTIGEIQVYNLKGLAYWIQDRIARKLPLDANLFDRDALHEAIEMRRLDKQRNKDDDVREPGKCETGIGWDEWKESFTNYCSQKKGTCGGPLSYVIRDEVDLASYPFRDDQELKMYQYHHRGNACKADNRKVAQLLNASTLTTDAYVYIESKLEIEDGRLAWWSLVDHYDGDGEKEKRTSKAQADLKMLHYKGNELVFPFERFSTSFLKASKVLNKPPNHDIAPGAQVDLLMQKMSGVSNTAIQAAMELAASRYKDSINGYINELSTTIAKRLKDQVHMRDRKGNEKKRKISERRWRTEWWSRTRSISEWSQSLRSWSWTSSKSGEALGDCYTYFTQDVGVPERLTTDMAKEFVGRNTDFHKKVTSHGVDYTMSEHGRKNQNYAAELEIGNLRRRWRQTKAIREIPERLWDFGLVHEARIMRYLPRTRNGRSVYEEVVGHTPDISKDVDFGFYDLVWWYDKTHKDDTQRIDRWLGPSHRVGNDLTYWILTENGNVILRSTVQHITLSDWQSSEKQTRIKYFNEAVTKRLDPRNHFVQHEGVSNGMYMEDEEPRPQMLQYDDNHESEDYGDMTVLRMPDVDDIIDGEDEEGYDKYLNTEVIFEIGGELRAGTVIKRAKGDDGRPIGRSNSNPMFDTRVCS